MDTEKIQNYAEQLSRQYNPEGLSPYPFGNIQKDKKDLKILLTEKLPGSVSGVIVFFPKESIFIILVNKTKPPTRRNFTIAHELGHYFLHSDEIKKEMIVDSDNVLDKVNMLYRRDKGLSTKMEIEANNFAASFLMPADLVRKAWEKLKDIEGCSQVFNVSVEAMSIRLSRLGLVT